MAFFVCHCEKLAILVYNFKLYRHCEEERRGNPKLCRSNLQSHSVSRELPRFARNCEEERRANPKLCRLNLQSHSVSRGLPRFARNDD